MKQLLYIPNGEFMVFEHGGERMPYEKYMADGYWRNFDILIFSITETGCWDSFIERNNLPDQYFLSKEQFEVVDI